MKKFLFLMLFGLVGALAFSQQSVVGEWIFVDGEMSAKLEINWNFDMEAETVTDTTDVEYEGRWAYNNDSIVFYVFETETTTYRTFKWKSKNFKSYAIKLNYSFDDNGNLHIVSSNPDRIPSGKFVRVRD